MTPLEALIKNFILIAGLIYLSKLIKFDSSKKILLPALIFLISFLPVLLLIPQQEFQIESGGDETASIKEQGSVKILSKNNSSIDSVIDNTVKEKKTIPLKTKLSITSFNNFSNGVKADLTKGENIIALLTIDCESCIQVGIEIGKLKNEIKLPAVYYLLLGDEKQVPEFFAKTKAEFPFRVLDEETFYILAKDYPPRIFLLKNGKIIGDWNIRTFSLQKLKDAILKL